jgi:hypothetical protein
MIRFALILFMISTYISGYCSNNDGKESVSHNSTNIKIQGNFKNYPKLDTTNTVEIERQIIDLNNDKVNDTIILENLTDLIGDPQLYSILRIKLSTKQEFKLKNVSGSFIDSSSKIETGNKLNSKYIYLIDVSDKKKLFLIWDYKYPDCTNNFEIVELLENGFKIIFNEDFIVKRITMPKEKEMILIEGSSDCGETQETKSIDIK